MIHREALFCRPETNTTNVKLTKSNRGFMNCFSCNFILTLNQKYWRAASHLSHQIFCLLFAMRSLFWQIPEHYPLWTLVLRKHGHKMWKSDNWKLIYHVLLLKRKQTSYRRPARLLYINGKSWDKTWKLTHMVHFPCLLNRGCAFCLVACFVRPPPAVLLVWHPVQ